MRTNVAHLLLAGISMCAAPAAAQSAETTAAADKQRIIAIAHGLETNPLDDRLRASRSWAIEWLTDTPDISVEVCLAPLGGVEQDHYEHEADLVVQYMLSMAAFMIEHPDRNGDALSQQLAGVEGALTAYQSYVRTEPSRSPHLDRLAAMRAHGDLRAFVTKAYAQCKANPAK